MIDLHSHILPHMDDGSRSRAMTLDMLRMMRDQGVTDVLASPHFLPDREDPEHFLKRRTEAYEHLMELIDPEHGRGITAPHRSPESPSQRPTDAASFPHIHLGAEVAFFRGIGRAPDIERLSINGSKFLLLEMPFEEWSPGMLGEIDELLGRGLTPVMAHIERFIGYNRHNRLIEELVHMPVVIQANGEAFLQGFGSRGMIKMLKAGDVHVLGSDAHNMTSRAPNMGPAAEVIRKKCGEDTLQRMEHLSRKILGIA